MAGEQQRHGGGHGLMQSKHGAAAAEGSKSQLAACSCEEGHLELSWSGPGRPASACYMMQQRQPSRWLPQSSSLRCEGCSEGSYSTTCASGA